MKPRLLFSELTGTIYVTTRYTIRPHPTRQDREMVVAQRKYDVTADFDVAVGSRRRYLASQKRKERKKS